MAAAVVTNRQVERGRRFCFAGTPEVYFQKDIDNSRLVKMDDPQRARENRVLVVTLIVAFSLVMVYAYQHLKAIDYGYQIEQLRSERSNLEKANSELRAQEMRLSSPERIEAEARRLGLQDPEPGQIILVEAARPQASGPVIATALHYSVVSPQ